MPTITPINPNEEPREPDLNARTLEEIVSDTVTTAGTLSTTALRTATEAMARERLGEVRVRATRPEDNLRAEYIQRLLRNAASFTSDELLSLIELYDRNVVYPIYPMMDDKPASDSEEVVTPEIPRERMPNRHLFRYAVMCPECDNSFRISTKEKRYMCTACNYEFTLQALQKRIQKGRKKG